MLDIFITNILNITFSIKKLSASYIYIHTLIQTQTTYNSRVFLSHSKLETVPIPASIHSLRHVSQLGQLSKDRVARYYANILHLARTQPRGVLRTCAFDTSVDAVAFDPFSNNARPVYYQMPRFRYSGCRPNHRNKDDTRTAHRLVSRTFDDGV